MYNLPSLNGLRTFEAAARCGSFVLAGQELGVSSAAVSLQVKSLEEYLGKKLFLRRGNRISLTDAGEEIFPKLVQAFSDISDAAQLLSNDRRGRQLVISVLPSLSDLWLLPRISSFRNESGVALDIRVQEDPIDFEREAIDLRITYGPTFYEGYRQLPLYSDVAVPVCSPQFWQQYSDTNGTLENVPEDLLIHNNWGASYSSEPSWREWMQRHQDRPVDLSKPGLTISDTSMAIAAAKAHSGMALAPLAMVQQDVEAGLLVRPGKASLKMKKEYLCVFPHARSGYPLLRKFLQHLEIPLPSSD